MSVVPTATERYRVSTEYQQSGNAIFSNGQPIAGSGRNVQMSRSAITDWVRPPGGSSQVYPLTVDHFKMSGGLLNKSGSQGNGSKFFEYIVSGLNSANNFPHLSVIPGAIDDVDAAVTAGVRSSPSRPYVDVPVMVLELGDVGQLLFKKIPKKTRSLSYRAAEKNIEYQFGVAPLVGDMFKLTNFMNEFRKRAKELKKLHSTNGFRKTMKIGERRAAGLRNVVLQSQGVFYTGTFLIDTLEIVKAHCRWTPLSYDSDNLTSAEIDRRLARAMLGLTLDASTAWELIPFSWLADYCSNIGKYFQVNRNIVPATCEVWVMRHTITTYSFPGHSQNDWAISPIKVVRETKRRKLVSFGPSAHFPFLSGTQMGIAASLAHLLSSKRR